jgi:hypothetical protein|tara:strand:- start:42 stop:725 length:684 start_codon:yes stop_codon:yes gene_type:complete
MKKLTEIIVEYSKKYVNENNDWYNWREINEDKLPMGIELPKGNQYLKNVVLKKELNKKWKESQNVEDKLILIKYYIATWGGIHTNSLESMEEYSKLSASQLIKNGKKGIASWSKAIVVHDPNEFAIFDARVAISLNCIQKLYGLNDAVLFPVLPSRNKIVALGNKLIKATAKSESWEKAYEENFYTQYLKILNYVAKELNSDISTIEMLLFAKAEELVQDAYPNSLN